jgi:acetyl esterase/lipase
MSSEDILSQTPPPADARMAYGNDPNQFFDLRIPRSPLHSNHGASSTDVIPSKSEPARGGRGRVEGSAFLPVAIVIHGGFWRAKYDLNHAGHLCAALTKAGIVTLNVEYRRVGNPGGGWPGSLQDIEAARRFLPELAKKHKVNVSRLVVAGHSAGGHLALALAARQNHLRGVVALAPVSDPHRAYDFHLSNDAVVEFLGGTPSQVPERYAEASPIELPISVPQVLIHGRRDDIVPFQMSRSYVETKRSKGENVRLVEPDCGHFDLIDPSSQVWPAVQQSVLELLKP